MFGRKLHRACRTAATLSCSCIFVAPIRMEMSALNVSEHCSVVSSLSRQRHEMDKWLLATLDTAITLPWAARSPPLLAGQTVLSLQPAVATGGGPLLDCYGSVTELGEKLLD
ncbi:hypothetical protein J6590_026303 [Homalodisca vitripennis]|nr:hypothetical protein J6590_026303 [Homalodisca vitripennis]